jgi:hypothetical protein
MLEYEPTSDDIQIMLKQVVISEDEAKKLLIKCNGNMFNAICYAMGDESLANNETDEEVIDIAENHVDPKNRITQFRNILDKKDKIFAEVTKKDEDILEDIYDVGFIPFGPNTTKYSKENTKITLKSFLELVAKPFIETGELENYKSLTFQDIKADPNLLGKKPVNEEEMQFIKEQNQKLMKKEQEINKLEANLKELESKEAEFKKETQKPVDIISDNEGVKIDVTYEDEQEDNYNNSNIETIIEKTEKCEKSEKKEAEQISKATEAIKKQLEEYFKDKLEVKKLTGNADKMIRKWRCIHAGIIYKDSNIKSKNILGLLEAKIEVEQINKLATKLLIHSEIIKKNQFYVGNAIVVDKWFHYNNDTEKTI